MAARLDVARRPTRLDAIPQLRPQVSDDPPVPLRPGQQRLRVAARPADARSEIKQSRPGARLLDRGPVIVAARVIRLPPYERCVKIVLVQPVGHRDPIEGGNFGIVRGRGRRNRKRPAALCVAPLDKVVDLLAKSPHFGAIGLAGGLFGKQPFVPRAIVE